MRKHNILLISLCLIVGIIFTNTLACWLGGNYYFIFYHLTYGLILSVILPLWIVKHKEKDTKISLGIKPIRLKQILILVAFISFSIGGTMKNLDIKTIRFDLFPLCIAPLIMSTFFEEFLFRGFMQTRFEKAYGPIIAVVLSGFIFSIYHLGYPGFRTFDDIFLLFFVGMMFALSFKLSGNNMIVSYFVNLPNAFLTYMRKSQQFPNFDFKVTIISAAAIVAIIMILIISLSNSTTKNSSIMSRQ